LQAIKFNIPSGNSGIEKIYSKLGPTQYLRWEKTLFMVTSTLLSMLQFREESESLDPEFWFMAIQEFDPWSTFLPISN